MLLRVCFVILLSALCVCAGDVSGKWSGDWEVSPDGGPGTHFMVLKQDGGAVQGTAGPTADQQMKIQNGKVTAGKLTFDIGIPNGPTLRFEFAVNGEAMDGKAVLVVNGNETKLKLAVKRLRS